MQNMAGGLGFDFGEFMLIGMLVNMLFMITSMGMASIVDDHDMDFNQEMLVSPVSRYSLVIGRWQLPLFIRDGVKTRYAGITITQGNRIKDFYTTYCMLV